MPLLPLRITIIPSNSEGKSDSVPKGYSAQTIQPSQKRPWGSNRSLALPPSSSNAGSCPATRFGDRGHSTGWASWPFLLGSSSVPTVHRGMGWGSKEMAQQDLISQTYHFLCSLRRPAGITTPKCFLLGNGQHSLKRENQTARPLPSGVRRAEHCPTTQPLRRPGSTSHLSFTSSKGQETYYKSKWVNKQGETTIERILPSFGPYNRIGGGRRGRCSSLCKMNIQKKISISTLQYRITTVFFLLREYLLLIVINADLQNCHENLYVQAHHFLPQPCKKCKEVETKHSSNSLTFNETKHVSGRCKLFCIFCKCR